MTLKQKILGSIEPIVKDSSFVKIETKNIPAFAQKLLHVPAPAWDHELQFSGSIEQTAQYYFLLDSINFCFWQEKGKEKWAFKKDDEWLSGYYGLSYALKQAALNNPQFLTADYLSNLSFDDFKKIFPGKGELLLLDARHKIVNENFAIIKRKYNGQAVNLVSQAQNDATKLVNLITEEFPTFRDWPFLKRAQIFAADLDNALKSQGLTISGLENLTVFADYKLPQLLEAVGILKYSDELRNTIQKEDLVSAGSRQETEIRANTVWACELLRDELEKLGRNLTSMELDWILWVKAKETKFALPYHKTVTIFY